MKLSVCGILLILWGAQCKMQTYDFLDVCSRSDKNLNECAKNATQKVLPILGKGIRSLHLIPLDPLNVPHMDLGQETGPVSLKWTFNNATLKGTSSAKVNSLRVNEDNSFGIDFVMPRFELSGDYVGRGKILLLPIDGDGFGNITATNMQVNMTFNCDKIQKKNVEYLSVNKLEIHFKLDKSYLAFSNLFGGNKELGRATNKFLNENADAIVDEMRGTLEAVFGEICKQLLNNFFHNVPLTQLFKD